MILLIKLTLVLLVGFTFVYLPRLSASFKYLAGAITLVCLPIIAAHHVLVPEIQPFMLPVPDIQTVLTLDVGVQTTVSSERLGGDELAYGEAWPRLLDGLVVVYLLGVFFLWSRLSLQVINACRWVARGFEVDGCHACGNRVSIIQLADAESPFTWGWRRPIIAVPALWNHWNKETKRMVVLHELAHVQRTDLPWSIFFRLICALFWVHPMVWVVHAKVRHEAEKACDDQVVLAGIEPADYAQQLLNITRNTRPQVALGMASYSKLSIRVRSLLDEHVRRTPMKKWQRITTVMVAIMLLVPVFSLSRADNSQIDNSQSKLSSEMMVQLKASQEALGQYRFEEGEQIAKTLSEQPGLTANERAQANNMLGYAHYLQGEIEEAVEAYEAVVVAWRYIPQGMHTVTLYTLAQLQYVLGDYAAALTHINAWFEKAATPGPQPMVFKGQVLIELGQYEDALDYVEQGIRLAAERGRADVPNWQQMSERLHGLLDGSTGADSPSYWVDNNRDIIPIVKVAPIYPADAQGVEGYVLVEFTVSNTGHVESPRIVEAEPAGVFDEAALMAVRKFKYKPKIAEGEAVAVHGIRNKVTFASAD